MPIPHSTHVAMLRAVGGRTYQTPSGSFVGVFKDPSAMAEGGDIDIESRSPTITCTTSDVTRINLDRKDTPVSVGDKTYYVEHCEKDGEGESTLFLRL